MEVLINLDFLLQILNVEKKLLWSYGPEASQAVTMYNHLSLTWFMKFMKLVILNGYG